MTGKDRNRNFTELQYLVQEEYAAPTGVLVSINNTASSGEPFLSLLPIEGTPYIADLHPVTARSQNYQIITEDSNGKHHVSSPAFSSALFSASQIASLWSWLPLSLNFEKRPPLAGSM